MGSGDVGRKHEFPAVASATLMIQCESRGGVFIVTVILLDQDLVLVEDTKLSAQPTRSSFC